MVDPSAPLDALLEVNPAGEGRYALDLPDGWQQGRGLFGGLVTGLMVRALELHRPGRPLRSLTAELCGPVQPGAAALELEALRDGSNVSTVAARLRQGGEVLAHGVGVLGAARAGAPGGVVTEGPGGGAGWREVAPLAIEPPVGPAFARFWEFRGDPRQLFGASERPETEGWVAPRRPGARRDAAFLAACVDAWWPALLTVLPAPRPMATIAFTFQPMGGMEGLDAAAPLRYRGRAVAAHDGYVVELRELWGEDGRLLALNQQTFCVIK